MFAYFNNGLGFRAVDNSYVAQSGEVLFPDYATPTELEAAFSGYAAEISAINLKLEAKALVAAGITVTSTGTPELNGVYPLDNQTISYIQTEMLTVLVNSTFSDGNTSLSWPDINGEFHTFPSTVEFKAYALASAAFISAIVKILNGSSTTLPNPSVTIP